MESQRVGRLGALLLVLALPCATAYARVLHGDGWAREKFATAERMREALNGRPAADRTRHDYQRVIDAYRRVYFGAPAASKADPSVVATAELLVEMGRQFDDDKILHTAIEQYAFLRREYPGLLDGGVINVEHDGSVAESHKVRKIPTYILYHNRKEVARLVGQQTTEQLLDAFAKNTETCQRRAGSSAIRGGQIRPPLRR